MAKTWHCPAHDGPITDYALLDKRTGQGRWKVRIRCTTPVAAGGVCDTVLTVMKGGVYRDTPVAA